MKKETENSVRENAKIIENLLTIVFEPEKIIKKPDFKFKRRKNLKE